MYAYMCVVMMHLYVKAQPSCIRRVCAHVRHGPQLTKFIADLSSQGSEPQLVPVP